MLENEVWKDCKGYEGKYQVSSIGRVWSVSSQKYLKPQVKNGYYVVNLYAKNGKMKTEAIHRLAALVFVENTNGGTVVNHINGDKTDNNILNLEWTTIQGNTKHAYDNNLGNFKGNLNVATTNAKKFNTNRYQIWKDDQLIGEYYGLKETAVAANCNEKTVRNCLKENRKTRNGLFFVCLGGDKRGQH